MIFKILKDFAFGEIKKVAKEIEFKYMERCLCGLRFAYSRSIRAIEEISDLDGRGVEFKSYSLRTSHVFLYS